MLSCPQICPKNCNKSATSEQGLRVWESWVTANKETLQFPIATQLSNDSEWQHKGGDPST